MKLKHTTPKLWIAILSALALVTFFSQKRERAPSPTVASEKTVPSSAAPPAPSMQSQSIAPQKYINGGTRLVPSAPAGLSDDEWRSMRQQIEEAEYAFQVDQGAPLANAANRYQEFKICVGESGIEVTPYALAAAEPVWHWRLKLLGIGEGEVEAAGRRAEVVRDGLTEWYENSARGVEQGFTIAERPAGETDELRLNFECKTSLQAHLSSGRAMRFEDETRATVLRYDGLYAYDAQANRVPAEFELSAESPGRLAIALNTRDAVFPITIDPLIATKRQRFFSDNPAVETQFGFAVAMRGDVCAIGSPPDDPDAASPATGSGSVYVFLRSPAGAWQLPLRIVDPELGSNRAFGAALDLSGHTLVVGSPAFSDALAPAPSSAAGAYIFRFQPGDQFLSPTGSTPISDPTGANKTSGFGKAVAVSGTGKFVAVASPGFNQGGTQTGGVVQIYPRDTDGSYGPDPSPTHTTWGEKNGAGWGSSLSFDKTGDSLLAVGAPFYVQPGLPDAGRADVLTLDADGVAGQAFFFPGQIPYQAGGRFGTSVSMHGARVAVGHPGAAYPVVNSDGTAQFSNGGSVHLFEVGLGWLEINTLRNPSPFNTEFGSYVSLDGDYLVIDSNPVSRIYARQADRWVNTFSYPDFSVLPAPSFPPVVSGDQVLFGDSGEVFQLHGNGWVPIETDRLPAPTAGERLGSSLAGAPDFMVVGSPFYSPAGQTNRGLASVITYTSSEQPVMTPLTTGAPAGAEFGATVATDGRRIAVGSPGFNGGVGLVSIFERDAAGAWIEVNGVPNPDTTAGAGDRFGSAIAIDGDRLVVGAALDGLNGIWAGRAWVFERDASGNWNSQPLVAPGAKAAFDLYGWAVDVDGDRIAVSEIGDDDAGSGAGAVHLFEWQGGSWNHVGKATPNPGDFPAGVEVNLGFSIDLEGDQLAAGAPAPLLSPGAGAGSVSVFARLAGGSNNWGKISHILPPVSVVNDEFGIAVQWHGDELVIGGGQTDRIHFFAAANGGESWSETSRIDNPTASLHMSFGHSFAMTRDHFATGIPFANAEAGELHFFRRPGGWHPNTVYARQGLDNYGSAVEIDGDTMVIGADRFTVSTAPGAEHGGVFVVMRNPAGEWGFSGTVLNANPPQAGARFGAAVAIDRDHVVVGAPLQQGGQGGAWDFVRRHNGDWLPQTISKPVAAGSQFGSSVAIDDRLTVVGSPFEATDGRAHVFNYNTSTNQSSLEATIAPPALPAQSGFLNAARFGAAVSIEGDTVAVGAPGFDLATAPDRGAAFLYERNRGGIRQWGQTNFLDGTPSTIDARFGESLDLSGDWLVVGAPGHTPPAPFAPEVTGAAFLFNYASGGAGNWGREQILLPSELQNGAEFGEQVAVANEWIAIAAPGRKRGDGSTSGAVELFVLNTLPAGLAEFAMQLAFATHTHFGSSLALGNRTLVVGDDSIAGSFGGVDVFSLMDHRERWGWDMFRFDVFDPAKELTDWGDSADGDGDGLPTILEYLMGLDPGKPDTRPFETSSMVGNIAGQKFLHLRYQKARWAAGSDYVLVPEWSFDLKTWHASGDGPAGAVKGIEQVVVADGEALDSWIVEAAIETVANEPQVFMRLRAVKGAP